MKEEYIKLFEILIAVLGLILAHRLWIIQSFKQKRERLWATFPFLGKFIIIQKAGIKTIFLHRDDIEKYRRQKEISEYITKNSETSFTYVGVWFSDAKEQEKISKHIEDLLSKNTDLKVNLYFRNSQLTDTDEIWFNDYYNCKDARKRIKDCIVFWQNWKLRHEPQTEERIKIFIHECNLTCSFFLFNSTLDDNIVNKHEKEIIFFDQKLYGCSKEQSISMEIKLKKDGNTFYKTVVQMYQKVKSKSKELK